MKEHGVYKFIVLVMLLQISLIAYLNPQFYIYKSLNPQQKRISFKNLRNSAQIKYCEIFGTKNNTSSIQIELPDLSWNITDIELNFANISQHHQLRTIEDNISVSYLKPLYYDNAFDYVLRYGQQINFSETTEVFGVYLYGIKTFEAAEIVNISLTSIDGSQEPDIEYHTQIINISNDLRWHYQDFSPYSLIVEPDDYYLLINGEDLYGLDSIYYFGCNTKSPTYPTLLECSAHNPFFTYTVYQGQPFMCKILQKVNKTYFPEELEMQAIINKNFYNIRNRTNIGEGNLSLTLLNFKPESIYFDVPIVSNDESIELVYNLSYYIKLRKEIQSVDLSDDSNDNNDSKVSIGISPEFFYFTIIIIILIFISTLVSYQAIRKIQIKKRVYREKFFNKYKDILNLDYVIVSDKISGLSIYEQVIRDKNFEPSLISGFLQAIRAFGLELTGSEEQSQTIKLEYQKSKIIMSEFKNYRIINIFEESPSKEFKYALESLSHDIDKYFGRLLENFDGELTRFIGIKELIEKHFQISLLSPLKIVMHKEVKLNNNEKAMIKHASDMMKKRDLDHFYISYLISEKEFDPKKAEIILNLISKRIFRSIY